MKVKPPKKRIRIAKIFELTQIVKTFSITWVAEDGHKVFIPQAGIGKDGYYSKGRWINIVSISSGEHRRCKIDTIIEFNGQEAFL